MEAIEVPSWSPAAGRTLGEARRRRRTYGVLLAEVHRPAASRILNPSARGERCGPATRCWRSAPPDQIRGFKDWLREQRRRATSRAAESNIPGIPCCSRGALTPVQMAMRRPRRIRRRPGRSPLHIRKICAQKKRAQNRARFQGRKSKPAQFEPCVLAASPAFFASAAAFSSSVSSLAAFLNSLTD